ncbi:MAG: acyl-CoA dehydrogenase family protein [Candidatus Dormibacteraeota bacterium]|nr:acyl-CoA dehydrogenase family protein [Candidatus Dormibacteraeota bacterium]
MKELDRVDALEDLRRTTAAAVAADGADAHQVEVDHLVWAYAHSEAARALREWASSSADPTATELASVAEAEALGFVRSAEPSAGRQADLSLAALARHLKPLEDVGANEDYRLLRSTLRDFADREIRPHAQAIHRGDVDIPERVISATAEMGLFGLSVPTEYGGAQQAEDFRAMLVATEELSRASLAAGGSLITRPEILVRALLRGGTEEQKRRWLPAIASGEKVVAVAVTEADHGSDVAGITCRARRITDGSWEIDGTKLWCTFGGRAELLMVLCRTADAGHRGLSVFVIEKPPFSGREFEHRQPEGGVLHGRAIPTIGYRGMHTFELVFEGFRAPADSLLGEEQGLNRGFYLQMEGFSMGRLQTAGRAVGLMQAAFEAAVAYARDRVVFGKPVLDHQLIQARIGRMALRLHASRQLSYRAAALLDRGEGQMEASLAKLYSSRMAELVTREAMQVHGAMGYGEETDASRYFVDARVLPIFEGAEETLSLRVIGRALTAPR